VAVLTRLTVRLLPWLLTLWTLVVVIAVVVLLAALAVVSVLPLAVVGTALTLIPTLMLNIGLTVIILLLLVVVILLAIIHVTVVIAIILPLIMMSIVFVPPPTSSTVWAAVSAICGSGGESVARHVIVCRDVECLEEESPPFSPCAKF
jgi:hypothetical protein